jgi:trigger factor
MQVSVEVVSDLERRLKVELPKERVENEVASRTKKFSQEAKLPGFRPGKVPVKIIEQRFGPSIRQEVTGELLRTTLFEAIDQEKLNIAGTPKIESINDKPGEPFDYVALVELLPEVHTKDFKELVIEKTTATVTDADVNKALENLRKQHTEWHKVERTAANGDQLIIDYSGTIDGQPFAGNEDKNATIVIGAGRMIAGFEEGFIGTKAGDQKTLHLKFPDQYHATDLAGKAVDFAVTVHSVSEPKLPELDEAFLTKLGITEGGLEKLREETQKALENSLNQKLKTNLKTQVLDKLLAQNHFSIPNALITQESERLRDEFLHQLQGMQNIPKDKLPNFPAEMFKEKAQKRAALGLLLREIISQHQMKADGAKIRKLIEDISSSYENPQQIMSWFYRDKQRLAEIESLALEDQIVDLVLQQAQVTEKTTTFDEIMNQQQPAENDAS